MVDTSLKWYSRRMPSNTHDQSDAETPHYHGHRLRLRERFHSAGPGALSDYELLEMVLFTAKPRGDMKPLAKLLIKKFGSFGEVINAPESRLREVDGVGERTVTELKLIAAAASRIAKGRQHGHLRTAPSSLRGQHRLQGPARATHRAIVLE